MLATTTLFVAWALIAVGEPAAPIDGFRLQDSRGAWHALPEPGRAKIVVIAFLGTECPLADQYATRLAELARTFEPKGVTFFGIDANRQDSPSELGRFAAKHDLPFPLLKDVGNVVADRLGAERTPEVFVLDEHRAIRYPGRVDDQYGFGVHRPAPTQRDLEAALTALLAGKDVEQAKTDAFGCRIGRIRKPAEHAQVTYSKQVARVFRDRCVACHREGEIAPFSLTSYAEAAGWAETIADVVGDGRMPPWHASAEFGSFTNEARLTDDERHVIADWVAAGAPEGDPHDLPEPATYIEGWRIPKPDLVVELPTAVKVPAEGTMPYKNFLIDPKLDHDVWVQASQVRPGNPSVVHHLVVFVVPPGSRNPSPNDFNFLAAYAPGMPPRVMPDGLAKLVPAGWHLLLQVHYTPRGLPQTDRSRVGFVFADPKSVRKQMTSVMAMNPRLRIPAGAADYAATAELRFGQDTILYSLLPHMHLRGKSFRFEAAYPDGRREVLLDVPRYEFEWQNVYVLTKPKPMPEGTVLHCLARYDNSDGNPSNPDPKRTVTWGEQTQDEMLVGYIDTALADQDLALGGPMAKPLPDGKYEVTFRHHPPTGVSSVYLAGTFNDWKMTALRMDGPDASGTFTAQLTLPAGLHEYKFVLDGKRWRTDPGNRRQEGFYHNSAIELRAPKGDGPPRSRRAERPASSAPARQSSGG